MKTKDLKIGLALSGGGMRAAIYHLGVLKYFAQQHLLSNVEHISTVSGASICMGLIYGCNHNIWPSDEEFLKRVLPNIREYITEKDIQWTALFQLLMKPYYWDKKVNLLGNVMEQKWNVHGCLQEIPTKPLWTINTTCFETGKDFRISAKRMGPVDHAYVEKANIRLSHAMAASAGFPVLIGPYKCKTKQYTWNDSSGLLTIKPRDRVLHLWDGGVYDNMGLDPLFTMRGEDKLRRDINFLVVSNASGSISHKSRTMNFSIGNLKRLLDINMNQVESIRGMSVKEMFAREHNGVYLKIGSSVSDIVRNCDIKQEDKQHLLDNALNEQAVDKVKNNKTSLEKVKPSEFDQICKHGYEVAESNMLCYGNIK